MGMPKNLYLVRHGESEGNLVNHRYKDTKDDSLFSENFMKLHESQYQLTPLGIEQAQQAGEWLINENLVFDRMLVSNNTRAMQTAGHLNLREASWMMDFNLRERENGLFSVVTPQQRNQDYSFQQKFHDTQPFLFRPPQGESIADTCQRVKIVLDTLARECDNKNVLIVCHGHIIATFRIILERMSLQKSNQLLLTKEEWGRIPNCSIVHYTREQEANVLSSTSFNRFRIIRPAGGGNLADSFSKIERKKYSNEELLHEACFDRQ